MRVITIDGAGERLLLKDRKLSPPKFGQLHLRYVKCGLNFADILMCKGEYQERVAFPFTPGMEITGEVFACGEGVRGFAPGDRVIAFITHGGLAEEILVDSNACRLVPVEMPSDIAAGFQIAYGTSHLALTRRARLGNGERLLVLGAAGGVGLTAVEVGSALGAHVVAVARGMEKCRIALEAGAHTAFDSEDPNLLEKLRALGGFDVVYDPVGGALANMAQKLCNPEARYLLIGFASGEVPQIRPNVALVKNVEFIGFYWGGYLKFAPRALYDSLTELMNIYVDGKLRPHVDRVLPLERAAEGLELIQNRAAKGKIVVDCSI